MAGTVCFIISTILAPESNKALLNQMDKRAAMQGQSVYGANSQEQSWNINQGQCQRDS